MNMFIFIILLLTIILIIILAFFFSVLGIIYTGVPNVYTQKKVIKQMLDLAEVKSDDKFYDLGSGDGRVLIYACRNYGVAGKGYEISIPPYIFSKIKLWVLGLNKKIDIRFKSFFNEDLSNADVIFCYLFPRPMEKLKEKFERELKPGARIVSRAFKIPGWKPVKYIPAEKSRTHGIYLYIC